MYPCCPLTYLLTSFWILSSPWKPLPIFRMSIPTLINNQDDLLQISLQAKRIATNPSLKPSSRATLSCLELRVRIITGSLILCDFHSVQTFMDNCLTLGRALGYWKSRKYSWYYLEGKYGCEKYGDLQSSLYHLIRGWRKSKSLHAWGHFKILCLEHMLLFCGCINIFFSSIPLCRLHL